MPALVQDPGAVALGRRLRALDRGLEAALAAVVVGTAAVFGAVHPFAYVPLWLAALAIAALLAARVPARRRLRDLVGPRRVAFHATGRSLVVDPARDRLRGWSVDLARPALPAGPLAWPAAAFLAWAGLQLLPLPAGILAAVAPGRAALADHAGPGPVTLSTAATLRGLAFVLTFLAVFVAAAAVLAERRPRRRFQRLLTRFGAALALVALAQVATGSERIYWFFEPWEASTAVVFGPFVNHNHFAGYMLLVCPIAIGLLERAAARFAARVGAGANLRRRLVGLSSREGADLLYALVPCLATVAALLGSFSRGGILAFAVAVVVARLTTRRPWTLPAWTAGLLALALFASWLGPDRVRARFEASGEDSFARTVIWRESGQRMGGLWLTGTGLNTFGLAMGRTTPMDLPADATPWPEPFAEAAREDRRLAFRSVDLPRFSWYREAHSDWLQVAVETGLPGLALAGWAALALLASGRRDPALLAALLGPLVHVLVDFDFQIPALAVLYAAVAGMAVTAPRGPSGP